MQNILAEIQADNREAAEWLLYYPFRRRQFYKDKRDIMCSSVSMPEIVIRIGPGNPTAFHALRLSSLEQCEIWLETIELVEELLSEEKQVFLKYRREAAYITRRVKGRPAWILYVQRHYADEMAKQHGKNPEDYWLGEKTMREWWVEITVLTARVLAKVKEKKFKKSK